MIPDVIDFKLFEEIYNKHIKKQENFDYASLLFTLLTAKIDFYDYRLYSREYSNLICILIERLLPHEALITLIQAFECNIKQNRKFVLDQFSWFRIPFPESKEYTVLKHFTEEELELFYPSAIDFLTQQIFEYDDYFSSNKKLKKEA